MIRIMVRKASPKFGEKFVPLDEADDIDEAMNKVFKLGPVIVKLTDARGKEIAHINVRQHARAFIPPLRVRFTNAARVAKPN